MLDALADFLDDVDRYRTAGGSALRALATEPGLWAVATYRLARAARRELPRWATLPLRPLELAVQLVTGVTLPTDAEIGPGLYVGHFGGIVVHPEARLGRDCNLSHGSTIGIGGRGARRGVPTLGDRVYLGPHAVVFGKVRVGDDAAIGANAAVTRDVPDGGVAVGAPARLAGLRGSGDYVKPARAIAERGLLDRVVAALRLRDYREASPLRLVGEVGAT